MEPAGRESGESGAAIRAPVAGPGSAEEALRRETERLERASVAGRVALWEWDVATGSMEWTSAVDAMLGFPPGGFPRTVQGWGSQIHPDDLAVVIDALDRHLRSGDPYHADYRIRRADGAWVYWHDVGDAERDGAGRPFRMSGTCVDVTERKRAEEALRIRDAALASSNSAIVLATPGGEVTYVNRAFLELWGYESADEVLGRSLTGFWEREERMAQVLGSLPEQGGWIGELSGRRKDGTVFDVQAAASLAIDGAARPIGLMGSFINVTARKRAEAEIRRLAAAVEQAAQSVVITDVTGTILYVNASFTACTGYAREEALGRTPALVKSGVHPPAFYEELWAALLRGETWRGRFTNRRKDGSLYEAEATITPVRDAASGIACLVSLEQDVTERLALERRLQEQEKLAAIGGIAAGIAHEVKNPLFAISSGIQLLQEELVLDEEQKETLEIIFQDVMRMDRLVRQLQLLSSRPRLHRSREAAADLIREAVTLHRGLLQERDLRVEEALEPGLPPLDVDRDQIRQVLLNVLQNAISVSPEGGRIEVRSSAGPGPGRVSLAVRDEGPGVPEELRERIFEPFFTTRRASSGMGLAISRRIALDHGGSLRAENDPRGGAVFVLELPAAEAA